MNWRMLLVVGALVYTVGNIAAKGNGVEGRMKAEKARWEMTQDFLDENSQITRAVKCDDGSGIYWFDDGRVVTVPIKTPEFSREEIGVTVGGTVFILGLLVIGYLFIVASIEKDEVWRAEA